MYAVPGPPADGSGEPLNEVQDAYDAWGNLAQQWQAQTGAVDTGSTGSVQYVYYDVAADGVASYVRLDHMVYPNGRQVGYNYAAGIDAIMSRMSSICDGTGTLSAYTYLGAGTIASEDYVQAAVKLDYSAGNFSAMDRFGRVLDQVWADYSGESPVTVDGYSYTYDAAGNRHTRENLTDAALNETYGYDALDRLTSWSVNGTQQESWSLDSLGNNLAAGGYNAANEETPTVGSSAYDLAGDMISFPSPAGGGAGGEGATYDAWDRMTSVTTSSGTVAYYYDGLGRRIAESFENVSSWTVHEDYLAGQQVVESDVYTIGESVARTGGYQYVWSPRYINAPLVRDTLNTAGTGTVTGDGLFYLDDANYNVTALVNTAGTVVERYSYTPYGVATVCDRNWVQAYINVSQLGNTRLFAGMDFDSTTGLYYDRARYYDAALERFVGRDPLIVDTNLYRFARNNSVVLLDPSGRDPDSAGALTLADVAYSHLSSPNVSLESFRGPSLQSLVLAGMGNEIGTWYTPSWTWVWVPYPGGHWDVSAVFAGSICPCIGAGGNRGKELKAEVEVTFHASVGLGAGGNGDLQTAPMAKGATNKRLRWSKGAPNGQGGQFAANPGLGPGLEKFLEATASASGPKNCPASTELTGSVTFEVGAKIGAVAYVNPYAKLSLGLGSPVEGDYGVSAGVGTYVGAEVYIEVTGSGGIDTTI